MFPFFNHYPGTDLHEIDLAYLLWLAGNLEADNKTLKSWKVEHEEEYRELKNTVDGLVNSLIDVIVPWDSSIAYRIFSIVEYQQSNYIAVKDVPVGIMITNTEYWEPANTVIQQVNAIAAEVAEIEKEKVDTNIYQIEPSYLHKIDKWETLRAIPNFPTAYNVLQGGDYNSLTDEYTVAYSNPQNSGAVIACYDTDFNLTRFSGVMALGHANDIAYNPDNNKLYIVMGQDDNGQLNKIGVVDATTLTLDEFITPPITDGYAWFIAYDKYNRRFYIQSDAEIVQTDVNFNVIKRFSFSAQDYYKGDTHITRQCSFFANNRYYNVVMVGNGSSSQGTESNLGNTNAVQVFNEDLEYMYTFYIREKAPKDEIESVCVLPDEKTAMIIYGQYYLTFALIKLQKDIIINQNYAEGISTSRLFEDGEDLNSIMNEGRCYSNSDTKTATLSNVPETGSGFDLITDHLAGYHLIQTARYLNGNTYTRYYNKRSNNASWGEWGIQDSPARKGSSINATYEPFSGYITGSGTRLYFTLPYAGRLDPNAVLAFSADAKIVIRGITGYATAAGSAGDLLSGFTVTLTKKTTGIVVEVNGLSIDATLNNTPVTVMMNAGTLDLT